MDKKSMAKLLARAPKKCTDVVLGGGGKRRKKRILRDEC